MAQLILLVRVALLSNHLELLVELGHLQNAVEAVGLAGQVQTHRFRSGPSQVANGLTYRYRSATREEGVIFSPSPGL